LRASERSAHEKVGVLGQRLAGGVENRVVAWIEGKKQHRVFRAADQVEHPFHVVRNFLGRFSERMIGVGREHHFDRNAAAKIDRLAKRVCIVLVGEAAQCRRL
jgi:hypothetical protein